MINSKWTPFFPRLPNPDKDCGVNLDGLPINTKTDPEFGGGGGQKLISPQF